MPAPELLAIAAASMVGSALAVWGVVRHELRAMRQDIQQNRVELARLALRVKATA